VPEPNTQLPLLAEAAALIASSKVFCCFELPGEPRAWERPGARVRMGFHGPFIQWYTRAADDKYREAIAWSAKATMRGRPPTAAPVALLVHAFLPIPPSWHWKRKQAALAGVERPISKPDYDNFLKSPADAMKHIVWLDDAQVVDGRCIKRYSEQPALRVEVREFVVPETKSGPGCPWAAPHA